MPSTANREFSAGFLQLSQTIPEPAICEVSDIRCSGGLDSPDLCWRATAPLLDQSSEADKLDSPKVY